MKLQWHLLLSRRRRKRRLLEMAAVLFLLLCLLLIRIDQTSALLTLSNPVQVQRQRRQQEQQQHMIRRSIRPSISIKLYGGSNGNNSNKNKNLNQTPSSLSTSPLLETTTATPSIISSSSSLSSKHTPSRRIRVERYTRLPVWPVWSGVMLFLFSLVSGQELASKIEAKIGGGRVCPMILHNDDVDDDDDDNDSIAAVSTRTINNSKSPFLLLVHHNHNFHWWDVIGRTLSKQFLPEGFPAHPHRGFTTLTYVLHGCIIHRDSLGIKQIYGTETSSSSSNNNNNNNDDDENDKNNNKWTQPAQWLFTGAGILHEEMFDVFHKSGRQELYQLWINVPAKYKLQPPQVKLLSTNNNNNNNVVDIPVLKTKIDSGIMKDGTVYTTTATVRVLAGTYQDYQQRRNKVNDIIISSKAPIMSDMNIIHVTLTSVRNRKQERISKQETLNNKEGKSIETPSPSSSSSTPVQFLGWTYRIPPHFETLMLYIREGSCTVTTTATSRNKNSKKQQGQEQQIQTLTQTTKVPIHSTVFIEPSIVYAPNSQLVDETLIVTPTKNSIGENVDFLLLAGQPLYETYTTTTTTTSSTGAGEQRQEKTLSSSTLEPVSMQGSMVMNYPNEIQLAYQDYQKGNMGIPWDYQYNDEQWKTHVKRFPCKYQYSKF